MHISRKIMGHGPQVDWGRWSSGRQDWRMLGSHGVGSDLMEAGNDSPSDLSRAKDGGYASI